jgi:hypothetical protein
MQTSAKGGRRWNRAQATFWPAALAAGLAVGAGGCANTSPQEDPVRGPAQMLLPRLTEALTGPAAGLLTNLDGYQGQFTISLGTDGENERVVTGALHERDGKLCYEPVFKKSKRKSFDAGAFSLIWDTVGKQGYILSDALQGFAPVAREPGGMNTSNGGDAAKPAELRVERAKDLNGLATRIQSLDPLGPFTLTLSGVRPGLPPVEMFVPPDGFTKYESESALLGELAARQRTVMGPGRKFEGDLEPYQQSPGTQRPPGNTGPGY